jgi:ribosomal protein L44E
MGGRQKTINQKVVVGKNVSNMKIHINEEDLKYVQESIESGEVLVEDLRRWFKEKWVDVSKKVKGKHPPCGRKDADGKSYPKCRPSKKVSKETPKVASSYDKKEKKAMTAQKRRAEKKDPKVGKGNKPTMTRFDEEVKNKIKQVVCDDCDWKWDLSDGGDDPYVCHKCGCDNSKKYKKMKLKITEEQFKRLFENNNEIPVLIYEDESGSVENTDFVVDNLLNEAEYQGRKVQLGKIMQGDVKKFKVYVKNDKGKVVKVNFGFGGKSAKGKRMVIKKNNPARRKSFRARHNCSNPGPRWKPRYWACRTW